MRRVEADRSQLVRRIVQFAFLALNLWVGFEFYAWVRFFETGGATKYVERPAGVDGWLPIDALMNLKLTLLTGSVPRVHPAGMFLLLAFLGVSLLFHKAFCSWLCPVGTLSEYLWKLGRKLLRRNFQLPRWVDIPLRGLKYLLLALFVWVIARMSVEALAGFLSGPYGIIADVKMLNFFRHIGQTGAIVLAVLTLLSLAGAKLLVPLPVSLRRVGRSGGAAQPGAHTARSGALHRLRQVRESLPRLASRGPARRDSLGRMHGLHGVRRGVSGSGRAAILGFKGAQLGARFGWKGTIAPWAVAACIAAVFLGLVGYARISGHWQTRVPNAIYVRLVPTRTRKPSRNVAAREQMTRCPSGWLAAVLFCIFMLEQRQISDLLLPYLEGHPLSAESGRGYIYIHRFIVEMESGDQPDGDPSA